MAVSLLLFAGSLALLLVAARWFTRAAEEIGLALGMSPFAVGVLLVSVGTSLPELVTAVVAVLGGVTGVVAGNVVGANVSNLLLVLAASAMAAPGGIRLGERYLLIDLHFLLGATFLLVLSAWDGRVGRGEGVFLLLTYALYVVYLLREGAERPPPGLPGPGPGAPPRPRLRPASVALAAGSAAGIYLAARATIGSLEELALGLGVPPAVVAVTLLSLGTTLPEMAVSAVAARQGRAELAVGNILGSCIFNALGVAGTGAVLGGLVVPDELLSLPVPMLGAGTVLFYLLTLDKRVSRWEGALFAIFYGFFVLKVSRLF
jgi:cation:H+ antiporter